MSQNGDTRSLSDVLVRALHPGYELRTQDEGMPTLTGHFAVFNAWAEIKSFVEGHFLERIAPGAFSKTFDEGRSKMRVLFQHGQDPQIGDKPLGPIEELSEDKTGAFYEVPLLDTSYNRDLIPGLEANLYGSSFRFKVMRESRDDEPERSEHNPDGIPERTIKEAKVMEFGPVTFPAYQEATAGVRSYTDEYVLSLFKRAQTLEVSPETVEEPPVEEETPDTDKTAPAVATRTSWSLDISHEEVNPWL